MTDDKSPYVGYMNPPKHTRFKKGTSGNPRGRPRKRKDPNTVLQRVLKRKIRVKDDDRRIPIEEALIRRLRELALSGDKQAWALQRRILTDAGYDEPDPSSFAEEQEEMDRMIQKLHETLPERKAADEA